MSDDLVLRGTESQMRQFRTDFEAFLSAQGVAPGAVALPAPRPAKRRLTDPAPLGHEAWVELLLEIGKLAATSIVIPLAKDVITAWVKDWMAKRGLKSESKPG